VLADIELRHPGGDHDFSRPRRQARARVTQIPIFLEEAIRQAVTPERAVAVIREAFRADGEGRTNVPAVINLEIASARGEFHVKTAHIEGVRHVAVKVASGFYDNPAKGLPSGSGLIALFDAATGLPAALLLDNGFLTDLRTGAAGAVAADVLARKNVRTVGVLGSGVQARHQVRCLRVVRSFSRVTAWSPTRSRLEAYAREMSGEGFDMTLAGSAQAVCEAADVLIVATPARTPIVRHEWLAPGVHVNALGADSPGKQELDAECLARADIVVVDRLSQCAAFGELKHALEANLITRDKTRSLGEIIAGLQSGRTTDAQITIADLTGVGFQDTAIASAAYDALAPGSYLLNSPADS
jgi:ornithine cyclodeaminase/alanine dehydrogenase-like protein (mu-crystallin family)